MGVYMKHDYQYLSPPRGSRLRLETYFERRPKKRLEMNPRVDDETMFWKIGQETCVEMQNTAGRSERSLEIYLAWR